MKRGRFRVPPALTPHSLRFQLLSRSLLVIAVILLFIGLFQYVFMRDFLFKNKAESMHGQLKSIPKEVLLTTGDWGYEGPGGRKPTFYFPDMTFAVFDASGSFTNLTGWQGVEEPPKLDTSEYEEAMKQKSKLTYKVVRDEQGYEHLVVLHRIEARGNVLGVAQLSMSTAPLNEVAINQLTTFSVLSLLALLLGLLAFIPVLKRTLVPLSKIVDTVERINAGNLDERFPSRQGQQEIDRLAVSFNGMLERLEASFAAEKEAKEQMRRFVADASHELRTPLTSIHGFLEVLLRGAMHQPAQLEKALKSMYGESERINKLVNDLLLLAKLDRAPAIEWREGDLGLLLLEMESQLRLLAGSRKVVIRIHSEALCLYDTDKMKQVVLNLFQNAVQHTDPKAGCIELTLAETADYAELTVSDNGPGIPEEHLPHVFDRFYRGESSRTRKSGGAGLGLAITKSIVDAHGGSIRAESVPGAGSTFTVLLPCLRDSQVN